MSISRLSASASLFIRFILSTVNLQPEMTNVIKLVAQNGLTSGNEQKLAEKAAEILTQGHVIALPTDTVYGIAALTQNTDAVQKLYAIKGRNGDKPMSICVPEVSQVSLWGKVTVSPSVLHDLLPGPVTLVFFRSPDLNPRLNKNTPLVGIRVPDHSFIRRVVSLCESPLALTSANLSSTQSTLSPEEFQDLWPKLGCVFDGGRLQSQREGSTVVDLSEEGTFKIMRDGSALQATKDVLIRKYGLVERQ